MRKVWVGIVLAFMTLEASALLALFLLRAVRHIEYTPILVTALSDEHRRGLEDLLAGRTHYNAHSPTLGWTVKPNGFWELYQANSKGLRGRREYPLVPPAGTLRIVSFGDSFTEGVDVKNEDTWQETLMSTNRNLEVLNFGVGGFGLDQAFLRYQQEGTAYHAHVVLIGFMSENIYRHVSVYRPFNHPDRGGALTKPRYVIEGDRLVLIPNPMHDLSQYRSLLTNPEHALPSLGTHDYYFRTKYREGPFDVLPSVRLFKMARWLVSGRHGIVKHGSYDVGSEAFKVTTRIFDQFIGTATQNDSVPVVLVFPNRVDILRHRREGTRQYAPLLAHFRSSGYRYIDVLDEFVLSASAIPIDGLAFGHYTPLGNRIVAQSVWRYLTDNRLVDPKTLRRP